MKRQGLVNAGVLGGVLSSFLLAGKTTCQSTKTAKFAVLYHASVVGVVRRASGQAVAGATAYADFPDISSGISTPRAVTGQDGKFSLYFKVFARDRNMPDPLTSLRAYVFAALPSPVVLAEPVRDTAETNIRFAPGRSRAPLTRVTLTLP
jgi:hypothetical protein